MSNFENSDDGDGHSLAEKPEPKPETEVEIWPAQYPSLVYFHSQDYNLMSSVLPTAPHPDANDFEDLIPVPVRPMPMPAISPPYYCKPMPIEMKNDREFVPLSKKSIANTSIVQEDNVTDVVQEEVIDETMDIPQTTRWTKKYCSQTCLSVGFFCCMIILSIHLILFHQWYNRYRMQQSMEADRPHYSPNNYY